MESCIMLNRVGMLQMDIMGKLNVGNTTWDCSYGMLWTLNLDLY